MPDHRFAELHKDQLRARMLPATRELAGPILEAIQSVLARRPPGEPEQYVGQWYRSASPASYNSPEAASAYLAAYGARSVLRYQEAVLALLFQRGGVDGETRVVDFGCGPGPGALGLCDLWQQMSEILAVPLHLVYLGLDREAEMLDLARSTLATFKCPTNCRVDFGIRTEPLALDADLLVVSNVLNEGEGINDPARSLSDLLATDITHAVVIEPATEGVSRALCGAASSVGPPWRHIGPCPSAGGACRRWTFRQFSKRVYRFEYETLGRWYPAARFAKYSLALFSKEPIERTVTPPGYVTVRATRSGRLDTCRMAQQGPVVRRGLAVTWDLVDERGEISELWP